MEDGQNHDATHHGRPQALKLLERTLGTTTQAVHNDQRELRILAILKHYLLEPSRLLGGTSCLPYNC